MGIVAAGRSFLRVFWRAAREVFHEVTGALFFVLALAAVQAAWRSWERGAGRWLVGMTAGYALLMICFGVWSFRDSRRVR